MAKLIIHGMRRSGTTILFDAFRRDPQFRHLYEPLAPMDKPSFGGGSAATQKNLFEDVSDLRRGFVQEHGCRWEELNYGAPRDPSLEFKKEFSPEVELYLQRLFGGADPVMAKFTRIYKKSAAVARLVPNSVVVLMVRDPRLVATSYVLGKNQNRRVLFETKGDFFDSQLPKLPWSAGPLSELAAESLGLGQLQLSQVERIILLWRAVNEASIQDGKAHFGNRFILLRHEEFSTNPIREIHKIYSMMELDLPEGLADWADSNIRQSRQLFLEKNPGWEEALVRTGAKKLFGELGYG